LIPDTTRSGLAAKDARDGDIDAVRRRAVDRIYPLGNRFEAKRTAQGERMADSAGFGVRGHNRHFPKGPERVGKRVNALRAHSIVVGDQDTFQYF
jgi:hypothetical protein